MRVRANVTAVEIDGEPQETVSFPAHSGQADQIDYLKVERALTRFLDRFQGMPADEQHRVACTHVARTLCIALKHARKSVHPYSREERARAG